MKKKHILILGVLVLVLALVLVLLQQSSGSSGSKGLDYEPVGGGNCKITGIGTCRDTHVVIPQKIDGYKVIAIEDNAFEETTITELTIPSGVTSIGDFVFNDCNSLTSVTIPDSVTSIGILSFHGCGKLKTIFAPRGLDVSRAGIPSKTQIIRR